MSHCVYLSLGSNLGNRLANLQEAITALQPKIHLLAQSSVYETEPWGYSDQPLFLNLALKGSTELNPHELLSFVKEVEASMGRKETFRFGPRLIDLDILFYDDLILDSPSLIIPHPRIIERAFVLVPLAEISPDLRHPVIGKTIQQIKSNVETNSTRIYQSNLS
jgi:2-amino-4-hydroxy-6-hydroxymethyldihydropteridine diphosphokinase